MNNMREIAYKQGNDNQTRSRWATWIGYAACAWGMYFAAAHVYWACGGSLGLPADQVQTAGELFVKDPWNFVISWGLLSIEFAIVALFPLALIWQGKRISQHRAQVITIVSGYIGMILFAVYSFATRDIVMGLVCCGICLLGVLVGRLRPRAQSAMRWIVSVATWLFGLGMAIYGCAYIVMALLHPDAPYFLTYIFVGGVNWLGEGALFVATAILARWSPRQAPRNGN